MSELFRQVQPDTPLTWTGERMVTSQSGAIGAEHFHRYFIARELCRSMDVLDAASGEGYGSAFLSQTARRVVGVEIDPQSVEHAASTYRSSNLQYVVGNPARLPIHDHSVDAVVSFETIEHLPDHRLFLAEVKRVLRPNGFLLISTPDVNVYSAPGTQSNPFHVRELTEAELRATLSGSFRRVEIIRQRTISGSVIVPDAIESGTCSLSIFEQRDRITYQAASSLLRATYLLAVASDERLPSVSVSLFIQPHYALEIANVRTELEEVRRQYEEELRAAGEKTHHEWSQLILAEEEIAKSRLAFDEAQRQSSSALQSASELAHQLERELSNVRSQMVETQSQRIQVERGLANARFQLGEVGRQLSARQSDLEAAKIERVALIKKLAELRTEADYHRQQLYTAVNSRSWMITKPLRALNSVLRGRPHIAPEPKNPEAATSPNPTVKDDDEAGAPFDRTAWDQQPIHTLPPVVSVRSGEKNARTLVDPVILHIHVPKCGGTAFRNFLKDHYGSAHHSLYPSAKGFIYTEKELVRSLADRNIRSISTHLVRTFPERLAERDLLYITFLRNPIDQFISYITYVKKNFQDLRHDQPLMACFPPDVTSLSIREIAHWILTRDVEVNFQENFTVNFFSRYTLCDSPNGLDIAQYRKQRLATAKKVLEGFLFVGLADDMNRSISLLRKRIEAANLLFPSGEVPFENMSLDFREDLSWINSDDEVGSLLLGSVREDQQLYDWAQIRLLQWD